MEDKPYREKILNEYKEINAKLGGPGASGRAAKTIIDFLHKTKTDIVSTT